MTGARCESAASLSSRYEAADDLAVLVYWQGVAVGPLPNCRQGRERPAAENSLRGRIRSQTAHSLASMDAGPRLRRFHPPGQRHALNRTLDKPTRHVWRS